MSANVFDVDTSANKAGERRIAAAKRLLSTDLALTEVADQTGFVDQSHLTNRFKAVVGVTPGAFRKMSKNLQDGR